MTRAWSTGLLVVCPENRSFAFSVFIAGTSQPPTMPALKKRRRLELQKQPADELRSLKTKVGRATAHATRETCCSKGNADMTSCVRRISARESKKASVDSAP